MIDNKATHDEFHTIATGDTIDIWWPSAGRHVNVIVLAVELVTQRRIDGTHFVIGAEFSIYNPWSYVCEPNGHQKRAKRVAVLHARRYSEDIKLAYTPETPVLGSDVCATLLAYLREHGAPERNVVVPDEVLAPLAP